MENGEERQVYFDLGLLIGDNLGLNSMLGFVESFAAKYFCRFCKSPNHVTATQCVEDASTLRTFNNYNEDVTVNDYSLNGIK